MAEIIANISVFQKMTKLLQLSQQNPLCLRMSDTKLIFLKKQLLFFIMVLINHVRQSRPVAVAYYHPISFDNLYQFTCVNWYDWVEVMNFISPLVLGGNLNIFHFS